MEAPTDVVKTYGEKAIEGIRIVEDALNHLEFRKDANSQVDKEAIYNARRNLKAVHLLVGVLIVSAEKPTYSA